MSYKSLFCDMIYFTHLKINLKIFKGFTKKDKIIKIFSRHVSLTKEMR